MANRHTHIAHTSAKRMLSQLSWRQTDVHSTFLRPLQCQPVLEYCW